MECGRGWYKCNSKPKYYSAFGLWDKYVTNLGFREKNVSHALLV